MKQIVVTFMLGATCVLIVPVWDCCAREAPPAISPVTLDAEFVQTTDQLKRERKLDVKIEGQSKRVVYAERYPIKKGHIEDLLARLQPGDTLQLIADQSPDGTLLVREIKLAPPPSSVETGTVPLGKGDCPRFPATPRFPGSSNCVSPAAKLRFFLQPK